MERTDFAVNAEALAKQVIKFADPDDDLFVTAKKKTMVGELLPKPFMTCGENDFIRHFVYASRDLLSLKMILFYYKAFMGRSRCKIDDYSSGVPVVTTIN